VWLLLITLLHLNHSLYPKRPILFFVLHPDNFRGDAAAAFERSGLGCGRVKIISEMHRKIKSALIF